MPVHVLCVRHGLSTWNLAPLAGSGRPAAQRRGPRRRGRAGRAARRRRSVDGRARACGRPTCSGPRETAAIIAARLDAGPVIVDRRLRRGRRRPVAGPDRRRDRGRLARLPRRRAAARRASSPRPTLLARVVPALEDVAAAAADGAPADRRRPTPASCAPLRRHCGARRRPPRQPGRAVVHDRARRDRLRRPVRRPATGPTAPTISRCDLPRRRAGAPVAFGPRGNGQARAAEGEPPAEVPAAGQGGRQQQQLTKRVSSASAPPSPCSSSSSCSPGSPTATATTTTRPRRPWRRRPSARRRPAHRRPRRPRLDDAPAPFAYGTGECPPAEVDRRRSRRSRRAAAVHRPGQDVHGARSSPTTATSSSTSTPPRRRARSTTS